MVPKVVLSIIVFQLFTVLLVAPNFTMNAIATHVSKPILDIDNNRQYYINDNTTILIKGWVEYNSSPASGVLLDIIIKRSGSDDDLITRSSVRSNEAGNFSFSYTLPRISGDYEVVVTSQCRDEHRNICTNQSDTTIITLNNVQNDKRNNGNTYNDNNQIILTGTLNDVDVIIYWTPNDIGKENTFDIEFIPMTLNVGDQPTSSQNNTSLKVTDYSYLVSIIHDGKILSDSLKTNQSSEQQVYVFNEEGEYIVRINLESPGGVSEGYVDFPIVVTPEFPSSFGLLILLSVALVYASFIWANTSGKLRKE